MQDTLQSERLLRVLQKLERRNGVTKQGLIAETGVSERTIERDLRTITRVFPDVIRTKEGRQVRYRRQSNG